MYLLRYTIGERKKYLSNCKRLFGNMNCMLYFGSDA